MHSNTSILIFLTLFFGVSGQKWHFPPPRILLANQADCVQGNNVELDSRINCNGGQFVLSMGYYIPCRAHKHCYGDREPPNWCMSGKSHNWTQYGCHCDFKIGSCVVERYQELGKNLEWAYCIPNDEYYCASTNPTFNPKEITTTSAPEVEQTTLDNLINEFK